MKRLAGVIMKVLHILEATSGGTRRHVLDLLPALGRLGIECELLASPARDPYFERDAHFLRGCGVRVVALDMARGFDARRDARALRHIRSHVRRHRPDIIHCHSTKAGVLGRLARLAAFKTPLVYTPHCLAFDTDLPLLQRRAARLMETLLAPLVSHFIAVSHHEQEVFKRSGLCRGERISTIHNGVDLKAFDQLPRHPRAAFDLQEDDFVIGCFGRLTRQKNQALLLRALPRVLKEVPRARLLLVGGGEDETGLRALARRLGIASHIHWTGEEEEARPYLGLCDLVAQPSRWEGCPYSVLEAMAARRAILATPVGGVPELLSGVCATEPFARGARDFATRIIRLAHDDAARQCIEHQVRGAVEDRFDLAQMVEKTRRVYESVL